DGGQDNPVECEEVDEIGAGSVTTRTVGAFQAARIMTGAQMPEVCDADVMLGLTNEYEREGKKYMFITRAFQREDNVAFQGEDTKKGTILVEKGTFIKPGVKALLATFGYHEVKVAKKPVIGIWATGSELLDVNETLVPGKIRTSNAYMISAQIE